MTAKDKVWPNGREIEIKNDLGYIPTGNQYIPYCHRCHHNHVFNEDLEDRHCEHPFCMCPERPWSKKEYDQVQHDPNCKCDNGFLKAPRKAHQKICPLHVERVPKYCGCVLILGAQRIPCIKKTAHRWDHAWHREKSGATVYWTGPDHKQAKRRGESLEKEVKIED